MTLKTLELSGFKSFGKKTSLSLTTPITCIVGPNGSGKSNIVEAIRFVLGEQSMKSLRGKGGVDLIFKGSKTLSSQNRASVSMTFDNSKKIFSFTNSDLGVSLDYDEIVISREVFADGANRYSINGTEVRLKDIVDLLASVNIGSSGHHIISQGEADRVLNASSKDRRAMIEDALGLKVYQYRIRESERKLEKTLENIKEVQSLRREVAPHLIFLKKQVQLIEKARELRDEIRELYKIYFSAEATYINRESGRLTEKRRMYDEKILSLDDRISRLPKGDTTTELSEDATHAKLLEEELSRVRSAKDDISRKLGRIEGLVERIERDLARVSEKPEKIIKETEWREMLHTIESHIDDALSSNDFTHVSSILRSLKDHIRVLHEEGKSAPVRNIELENEFNSLSEERSALGVQMNTLTEKEKEITSQIEVFRQKDALLQNHARESERVRYELLNERNEVSSSMHSLVFEEEKLSMIKTIFETDLAEAGVLIGREVIDYARTEMVGEILRQNQDELRRKIERIKIKLEDSGTGNSSEIMKEYEDTEERDRFLAREIDDLNTSIRTLRDVILELKETLDREFKTGVEKINRQFQEFFALMFGGGSAFLSVVMEHKKPKKSDEMEEGNEMLDEETDSTLGFERGIEIHVSLPQKKVKDLNMLSGGERSLTSIALLFAMSQVNPPPFLVLDETDAALDEANSRKYGNMLENLSKFSELIVVTHNRETMSRAQILYGVTMGAEGASKLLSIHLEDASMYAK
ncbi:MAG: AAA family ATPase [Candidatus Paceibacterota bacterium]